jgi:hypothetical protein
MLIFNSATMSLRTLKLSVIVLIVAAIFSVTQAASADAGNKVKHSHAGMPRTVVAGTAGTAQHCRGANLFHCGPLYNANDYLGDDPDPFIRLMIQRDLGIKYGGEQ